MTPRRSDIVITGLGSATCNGLGVEALWRDVCAAASRATWWEPRPATLPRTTPDQRFAICRAPAAILSDELAPLGRGLDRSTHLALAAADEALRNAGFPSLAGAAPNPRLAIIAGTSRGPVHAWAETLDRHREHQRPRPSQLPAGTLASLSGALADLSSAGGPTLTLSATCCSGAHALALGAELLLVGACDAVLAGATDAPLHDAILQQFAQAGLLGTHADVARVCRPFDSTRDGTMLGEGAGFVILERAHAAHARRARPRSRLLGWSMQTGAADRTGVDDCPQALVRALEESCALAGVGPSDVDLVSTHGTGTVRNDAGESAALRKYFGGDQPVCSATKPITGHCAGATATLEAILCTRALEQQFVPPRTGCDSPDPACGLRLAPPEGAKRPLRVACSTSLGFWGTAACLVLGRTE